MFYKEIDNSSNWKGSGGVEAKVENNEQWEETTICEPIRKIEFRNVSLFFPGQKEAAIKNVNMTISAGEKVFFLGEKNAGKSILMKMILGMYKPSKGKIYINDVDIDKLDKKQLRKQIGIVPEDIMLYNKSVHDNLTLGREDISEEQVLESTKRTDVHEYIESLSEKYNTQITDFGMKMPTDYRQKIGIARTMLQQYSLIILDGVLEQLNSEKMETITQFFMKTPCTCCFLGRKKIDTINEKIDQHIIMKNGAIIG